MTPADKKQVLQKSAVLSNASLILIFLIYIILSEIPFTVYSLIIMVGIIIGNSLLFMHFKNIMRDQESDENIFEYISDDLSWRYVTYLSIFFLVMLIAQGYIKAVDAYSDLIILNAFIIFIWAVSANSPMVNILVRKSEKLQDIYINFELGQKYSDKYKSLIGKDISVYTFKHTDDMPFAFLIENNDKPDIYIEEDLIDELSSNEMDMLLLHELGHYKAHHERKKNISVKIFIFSLLLLILSYTLYLNTNSIIFFYAFALFFPGLAIAIIVYLVILISMEQISADRFALRYMKDNENYLNFLEKLKLYTNSIYHTEKKNKYAMKGLDRRIRKIKGIQ